MQKVTRAQRFLLIKVHLRFQLYRVSL
jgi:hypothetical protein